MPSSVGSEARSAELRVPLLADNSKRRGAVYATSGPHVHRFVVAAEDATDTAWHGVVVLLTAVAVIAVFAERASLSVAAVAVREELQWSHRTLGLALGACWWGFLPAQLPALWLARRLGGRRALAAGVAASSLAAFLHGPAASLGPLYFCGVRAFVGAGQALSLAAANTLLAAWVPSAASSRAAALGATAAVLGPAAAGAAAPSLVAAAGWPAALAAAGAAGLLWLPPWLALAADRPCDRPLSAAALVRAVSGPNGPGSPQKARPTAPPRLAREPSYERLAASKRPVAVRASSSPPLSPRSGYGTPAGSKPSSASSLLGAAQAVPWRALLAAPEVWAIVSNQFASSWALAVLLSWLPLLAAGRFGASMDDLPLFLAVPCGAQAAAGLAAGLAADALVRAGAPLPAVRRFFQAAGTLGPAVCLPLAASFAETPLECAAWLAAGLALSGCTLPGAGVSHLDVAPRHAGAVLALADAAGRLAALLASARPTPASPADGPQGAARGAAPSARRRLGRAPRDGGRPAGPRRPRLAPPRRLRAAPPRRARPAPAARRPAPAPAPARRAPAAGRLRLGLCPRAPRRPHRRPRQLGPPSAALL